MRVCKRSVPAIVFLSCLIAPVCHGQSRDVICRDGTGDFAAEFPSGVRVSVGAARSEGFASRSCEAALSWGTENLEIASAATELDIDVFGVDLGLGVPVAALQVKKSKAECCMTYEIYPLRAPSVLLRSITGGEFFSAADTDLDGRVEIWTNDAAAVDGFEHFRLADLDFAPPVVLRFMRRKLLDASADFKPYFDQKIAEERAKLDPRDLKDFKNSDGQLSVAAAGDPPGRPTQLRRTKMRVLEIVWAYLYSGREREAWESLAEMWPAADFERIRAALLNARDHGIRSQLDGIAIPVASGHERHAKIFDGTVMVAATPGLTPKGVKPKPEITPPRAILMERPPPMTDLEIMLAQSESELKLVIDSAGKVRSVEVVGNVQAIDEGLIKSTSNWKFIPAYNGSEPVASQIFLGVSLKR